MQKENEEETEITFKTKADLERLRRLLLSKLAGGAGGFKKAG
uniref:Uncharacterized protein n=1 Tax=Los Azufres archaeal virus 2 TaxID=1425359 RepID=A0A0A0PA27_9VIRU|nr:hypothetical protein [Los Azufres archaeal virus 2]